MILIVLWFILTLNKNDVFAQSFGISLPSDITLYMDEHGTVDYNVTGQFTSQGDYYLYVVSENAHLVEVQEKIVLTTSDLPGQGNFSIYGNFIGRTNLNVSLYEDLSSSLLAQSSTNLVIIRRTRVIDTIFTVSVALLVIIIYINFGCALNWNHFFNYLKKPIGPSIGFAGQFVLMPLLSYGVGYALFPDNPSMQLGFFFVGCSPGGGGSNIWTALLNGNIDLSITMTGVSTLAAFGMIPLWIFTLGATIFDRGNLEVPYRNIATFAVGLIIPLFIGYLVQRYLKKVSDFLTRTLKVFSGFLILFIIVFAIVTNLYLFELFSWQIVVSGMCVPWLGYLGGYLLAMILRQSPIDCLTIAIEVGLQNTGIAIFLLRFSLPQPEADLTTIAPVSVACMTPIPLLTLFLAKLIMKRVKGKKANDQEKQMDSSEVNADIEKKIETKDHQLATIS